MENVKHTPGPYRYHEVIDENGHLYFIEVLAENPKGGFSIIIHSADVRMSGEERIARCKANARLIANAPDLLALLREWVEQEDRGYDELCVRTDAIIAKAEGK